VPATTPDPADSATHLGAQPHVEHAPREPGTGSELEQEIRETRQQLGVTVEELSHRLDPKVRARESAAKAQEKARENPVPFALAGLAVVLLVIARIWRRKH
jgi:hypothetical protein